jgi:hypothetical protein
VKRTDYWQMPSTGVGVERNAALASPSWPEASCPQHRTPPVVPTSDRYDGLHVRISIRAGPAQRRPKQAGPPQPRGRGCASSRLNLSSTKRSKVTSHLVCGCPPPRRRRALVSCQDCP